MKKYLIIFIGFGLFSSFASAQVPGLFGTKCEPSLKPIIYETLAVWHNNNKYSEDEVRDVTADELKETITSERFLTSFTDKSEYEIYRFSFRMGEESVGVILTVDTNGGCYTDESYVNQYN